MRTEFTLQVRRFLVVVRELDTGEEREDEVVLTAEQLRACYLVGQSAHDFIRRLCGRNGLEVIDVGKSTKREISVSLDELYRADTEDRQRNREGVKL